MDRTEAAKRARRGRGGLGRRARRWAWGVLVPLAAFVAGCSGGDGRVEVFPVSGKVTVKGEAPVGALIVLYPVGAGAGGEAELRPSGKVGEDGGFSLTTYDAGDGAPSGEYAATIQWNKLVKKGSEFVAGPNAVPTSFGARETSPWKIKIVKGKNQLDPYEIKN